MLGQGSLSIIDNLTLLYTRRHLHETVRAAAQRAQVQDRPFSVILVELTGIEEINERSGYTVGDEKIRDAAQTVQSAAARLGGTAYRHGGNRLAMVVLGLDASSARTIAAEVSAGIEDGVGARVATAIWNPGDSGDAVIARARTGLEQPTL